MGLASLAPASALSLVRVPPHRHDCDNYPSEGERRLGHQGDVMLDLWTDTSGRVVHVVITHASGDPALDKASLACVAKWTYSPVHEGRLISVQRRLMQRHVKIRWRLD